MSTSDSWYVIHTRSRHEKVVSDELTSKGIENYLPVYHEWHSWKDRRKQVEAPVFPGYVFARFQDCADLRVRVLRTTGAVRILGNGGGIEPIPDVEVETVQRMLATSQECIPHPFLREGAWVHVRRGPLKGVEGLLVEFKNRNRLVVSINLLSQSVATEVDLSDVTALNKRRDEYRSAFAAI